MNAVPTGYLRRVGKKPTWWTWNRTQDTAGVTVSIMNSESNHSGNAANRREHVNISAPSARHYSMKTTKISKTDEVAEWIRRDYKILPIAYSQALKYWGIGRESVKPLIQMGLVKPLSSLSFRTSNVLERFNLTDKEEVRKAILDGSLSPRKNRNYGCKSHREVHAWLGLPEPIQKPSLHREIRLHISDVKEVWKRSIEEGIKLANYTNEFLSKMS